MIRALDEQARTLWHVSNWFTNEPALRLAQRLVDSTFAERVFFCNSGAEANEAALKLARRYAHDRFGAGEEPRDLDAQRVPRPHAVHGDGRRPGEIRDGLRAESRPGSRTFRTTTSRRSSASSPTHGGEICAVILEPMQGEGGMTPGTPEFLQAARRL